jgi:hypothetical protein
MKTTLASAAVLLLVASSALAQQAPKPAPEMSQLKYFAGSWKCSGDAPASPFGPAHKTESSLMLKLDLDGFWYDGPLAEMKTASNTQPVKGMIHLVVSPPFGLDTFWGPRMGLRKVVNDGGDRSESRRTAHLFGGV